MTSGAVTYFFTYGRRALFAFLLTVLWLVLTRVGRRRRILIALVIVLSAPALIGLSNLYQAYRLIAYRGVPIASVMTAETVVALLEEVADTSKTTENLHERQALWRTNHDISKAHIGGQSLQWGALFFNSLPNYIPAALYPDKGVVRDPEQEMLKAFELEEADRSGNIFVFAYADFGMLGYFVAAFLLILFVWTVAKLLRALHDPLVRVMLMGGALFYALNLEVQYTIPVQLARDFAIFGGGYLVLRTLLRAVRAFFGQFRSHGAPS
jgi:hypothetical protein